jgi:uncharacterized membrane protein YdbT with pleckstrin-like domain
MENLQKLHPRVIWIWLIHYILSLIFFSIFLSLFLGPFVFIKQFTKTPEGFVGEGSLWEFILSDVLKLWIVIFLILMAWGFIWCFLSYKFYRYQLTDLSLKIERGVIYKRYVSIPYERVQNVDIYRSLLERILGLSSIYIQTAGSSFGAHPAISTEGRLPGLDVKIAEEIREELIKRTKGSKGGI